jgi:hypothetical protein
LARYVRKSQIWWQNGRVQHEKIVLFAVYYL